MEAYFQDFFGWEYMMTVNVFWTEILKFLLFLAAGLGISMGVKKGKAVWIVLFAAAFVLIHCLASASMTVDSIADRFVWTITATPVIDGLLLGSIAGALVKRKTE